MSKNISINLNIAENRFSLTIPAEEEEVIRKAAKLLDDGIGNLLNNLAYSAQPRETIVIGAALNIIIDLLNKTKVGSVDVLEDRLEEIRKLLEDSTTTI